MQTPKISVVMPTYNAQDTVLRAIKSVLNTPRYREIEIVVVDDCSKDNTCGVIREMQRSYSNIRLLQMPQNSGSPSGPRNLGIESATGDYITFLDDDDWFDADRLMQIVDYACENKFDFIKGYLILSKNGDYVASNCLPETPATSRDTLRAIISIQSMTQDYIVRRAVLVEHNLRYDKSLKIGEDTVLISQILVACEHIGYIDNFFLYYNKSSTGTTLASTQRCGDREVNDQLTAWERTQEILAAVPLDYYKLRLPAGFRNLLLNIIQFSEGISEETYRRLYAFANATSADIKGKMNLHRRYKDLYDAILSGDYEKYLEISKRRLLVAGYDLKFILPVIPYLEEQFSIRVDEWTGHASHDEKKSREMAGWADIIWCEWLLGNAVFYAGFKNENQRLVIRAHRFELAREFGLQVNYDKVDIFITVGYYYFEQFAKRFAIPREKMRLLGNYVEGTIYSREKTPEARFHVGIVGILPARKGFLRALEIIRYLREKDDRFRLHVMGKAPAEVPWIKNNPSERDYFARCDRYIVDSELSDSVVYGGFVKREQLYNDLGYVLSLSDREFPESFHLAPAEGALAGCMGLLLKWPGVEYIYPPEFVADSIEEIAKRILRASNDDVYYNEQTEALAAYVTKNFGMEQFLETLRGYLSQLFIL